MTASQVASLQSEKDISHFFDDVLGYQVMKPSVPYTAEDFGLPKRPCELIHSIHLVSDYYRRVRVYLMEVASLRRGDMRAILEPFYRRFPMGNYLFVFTTDYEQLAFVSPQRLPTPETGRVKLRLRILPVDRSSVYHTDLEVLSGISLKLDEQDAEAIWEKHLEWFNVERVTQEFFNAYKKMLNRLKDTLHPQRRGSEIQIHGFAQQLLNRLMFLYFLQKKDWLKWGGGIPDKRYIRNLWEMYQERKKKQDTFYSLWLSSLFFHAFNKRYGFMNFDLPGEVKDSLRLMPFLNGGLFTENELDDLDLRVPDTVFEDLFDPNFGLLERYNFTVREDTPLEVEVAVDPEMLGKVYESLIAEEEQHRSGIFYTPREEIDYMCRLSLIEQLHGKARLPKECLIPLVVNPQEEIVRLSPDETRHIQSALEEVRIVDPAVGSGSFLVGMMNVLVELYQSIAGRLSQPLNTFALKRRIISENLYGVDVKDWAVRVCELRLWLSLIIESEEQEMDIYSQPLLPNLTFKVRQGDSLVEEIGRVSLSLRNELPTMSSGLRRRITQIIEKKADYFRGDRSVRREEIERLEGELFRRIIDDKVRDLDREITRLRGMEREASVEQLELIHRSPEERLVALLKRQQQQSERETHLEQLRAEKERLLKVRSEIHRRIQKDYFLWDIDFAEVFSEKSGFDIVIGNPPYVRRQDIAPPLERPEDYKPDTWRARKKAYKEQLERSLQTHWGSAVRIDKKSDLYIYFYYHGLALLRPGGVFCFINSNSWLDVGYGAPLQEFLLRYMEPKYIIDNQVKRTFAQSDVNTVIVLIQRPRG